MNEILKVLNELLMVFFVSGLLITIGFIIFLRKHEIDKKRKKNK
jgi:hypothetical protein